LESSFREQKKAMRTIPTNIEPLRREARLVSSNSLRRKGMLSTIKFKRIYIDAGTNKRVMENC
jgi:hypothetical protein